MRSPYPTSLIKAENLSKRFSGSETWAVKDLTFQAEPGEIIGLIGENGAGKSTLLRLMATMLKPSSGSIKIAGYDTKHHPEHVRRSIGVLFAQQNGLYDRLSALENILYFA